MEPDRPSSRFALPGAVLFDMDGTLIDSEELWLAAEVEVMAELGASWGPADQAACLGGPLERVVAYMVSCSGTTLGSDEVAALLLDAIEGQMRRAPLQWRPGAAELLGECIDRGLPRVLVTASWERLVLALSDRIYEHFGLDPFTGVIAGDHVTSSKPHPEPYLLAAAATGIPARSCLAIEDSPTGVASAIAAGCKVIAVPHIANVDHVVDGSSGTAIVGSLSGHTLESLWSLAAR